MSKGKAKKKMNVLVFNCGSSSLKYRFISMPDEKQICSGEAQRIGAKTAEPARIIHKENGKEEVIQVDMGSHGEAFNEVLKILKRKVGNAPDVLGHRVVHGAEIFKGSVIIDAAAIEGLRKTLDLAPLHNPPALALIEACHKMYPELPQVAVFDTGYHATIPEYAKTYALPKWVRDKFAIKKYGFHGTSHQFVVEETAKLMNIPIEKFNAVSCHLGSGGASLCAVVNGKSVDNTMGYTPQPGLVMSTRSGDIDPAIALKILGLSGGDYKKLDSLLNKKSGVLGMSGVSGDIRDIIKAVKSDEKENLDMELTLQVYLWRIKKAIGTYLAIVGKPDAVIFTDTIGELVPEVRWAACSGLEAFGIKMDAAKNTMADNYKTLPADIAAKDSEVRVWALATNEELAIARVTASVAI
ncbi:MAG: acetate/propionate family kinase [bacterium]